MVGEMLIYFVLPKSLPQPDQMLASTLPSLACCVGGALIMLYGIWVMRAEMTGEMKRGRG